MSSYLDSVKQLFEYYKSLGQGCFDQISEGDINFIPEGESNSIGILVKHLAGNMHSRFTNFLTEDGEKSWRKRDDEFVDSITTLSQLNQVWDEGWQVVFDAVEPLSASDLDQVVYIRNEGHTVTEALNRQLAHYAYHVGQIVFLSKMIIGDKWNSLSIPKGQSQTYNKAKFNQDKGRRHFTEDL